MMKNKLPARFMTHGFRITVRKNLTVNYEPETENRPFPTVNRKPATVNGCSSFSTSQPIQLMKLTEPIQPVRPIN